MRIKALTLRILSQLKHDRRTLALILFAPLIILGLLYLILTGTGATYDVVAGQAPEAVIEAIQDQDDMDLNVININGNPWTSDETEDGRVALIDAMKEKKAIAAFTISDDLKEVHLYVDGTNAGDAAKVSAVFTKALQEEIKSRQEEAMSDLPFEIDLTEVEVDREYVYGKEDATIFDSYGAALIGIIIFFFVFIIAGINFLTERTSGTLEKMLSTPIRRSEIVIGYVCGFSVLAVLQTIFITLFVVYVIGINVEGSLWYVLLFNLLTAICALTMGILISSLANSEFQMVQFIPIIIIPQVFLCGLFTLPGGWDIVGHFFPLYYTTDGLQKVILRGAGIGDIWLDLLVLLGFSLIFLTLTIRYLKRLRSW